MMMRASRDPLKAKLNLVFLLALLLSVLTSSPEVTDFGAVFSAQANCQCDSLANAITVQENESLDKSDSSKNENFEESLPQRSQNPIRINGRDQLQLVFQGPNNTFLVNVSNGLSSVRKKDEQFSTLPRWLTLRTLLI